MTNVFEFMVVGALCWLTYEVRRWRKEAGQVEIAIADLHTEMRGRLIVLESEVTRQPAGDGDHTLITRPVANQRLEATLERTKDPRWN